METNIHNWHWGFQSYVASWLDRNLCPPEHNFSWLALTEDEFASSGATKNKILEKFHITFWAKSGGYSHWYVPYSMRQNCTHQTVRSISWQHCSPNSSRTKKICLPFTKLLHLYIKILCTDESKYCVFVNRSLTGRKGLIEIAAVLV